MNSIKHYENIALSDSDVLKLVNGKANLVLYPNIHKYRSLDELLQPYGACIVLYEAMPRYGHWCCIFKINDKLVEYFNPYGGLNEGFPDGSLEYIDPEFRARSKQDHPYLSYLMYNSPYELSYNEHKFQKHDMNIKTCGRWCGIRLVFRSLLLEDFKLLIDELKRMLNVTNDEVVTILTMYINK